MRKITFAAAAMLLASPAFAADAPGDAARGKQFFVDQGCYTCHGFVGQGGPGLRLAPDPLPAEAIAAYIRNPAGEMPPISAKLLPDQGVRDIQAYLASVKKPPKLADIPLLKAGE